MPPLRGGAVENIWFEPGKQFQDKRHCLCYIYCRFAGLLERELIENVRHLRVRESDPPESFLHLMALDLLCSLRALRPCPRLTS